MKDRKVAFVFSHPAAHELVVAGLIQRYHADVLFVTQADSGLTGSTDIARESLEHLEICRSFTFLEMSEIESYRRAFAADFAYYHDYRNRILDWLQRIQPDVVFGDALECYNFHHDLTRVMLDDALREYRRSQPLVANFEYANVYRTADDIHCLQRQAFPDNAGLVYQLTPEEMRQKLRLLEMIGRRKPMMLSESVHYAAGWEMYRPVPVDRDYTIPSAEFKLHYEEWGKEQVRRGKYERALLFDQHFAPIVRSLLAKHEGDWSPRRAG